MHTQDFASVYSEKLAKLFPECITEVSDGDAGARKAIDMDKLKQLLASDAVEGTTERYQFTWPDKKKAIRLANAISTMTLRPCREESVDFDSTENLYIEGDNLEVLKLLRENYLGKVKLIFIDPPYNTGNDFVYEDDFRQSVEDYIASSGQSDYAGNRLVQNTESNGRFHTDWLNMLYPRLRVAKDLLHKEGSIFITLDDHEYANAKKVCDEIFGEHNFVATIIWENFYGRSNAAAISPAHNYILLYSKSGDNWKYIRNLLERDEKSTSNYKNPDNDPKGAWRLGPIFASGERHEGLMYTITTPNGDRVSPPKGSHWRMLEADFWKRVQDGSIVFGMDGKGAPATKLYLSEVQAGLVPRSIWMHDEAGHTQDGKRELMSIFPECSVFDTPKPTKLIKQIIKIACKDDDIVLDFFSGSATTADAVLQLNSADLGHRKYIMVQLPESIDPESDAYRCGFVSICEVGKERIRRAGRRILEELEKAKTEEDLFAQSESIIKVDVGFRVLKLDSSNMQDVYYRPEESSETTLFEDNIKPDRTPEDLLFQVMLECNLPLSAKIETKKIAGKDVFCVNNGYLIACFDVEINEDVIKEVAKMKPYYFILRDSSLSSDNVADNFDQIFQAYSKETIRRVL